MERCEYKNIWRQCKRDALDGSKFCIFHDPNKDKDAGKFWSGIEWMIENGDFNFEGFHFIPKKGEDIINFESKEFDRFIDFSDAKFSNKTNFFNTKFNGAVQYEKAQFFEDVSFSGARFAIITWFNNVTFFKNVEFYSIFEGYVYFDEATFSENRKADFSKSQFYQSASFERAKFLGRTLFDQTTFSDFSNWERVIFNDVDFSNVYFEKPEKARFYHTDLTNALFSPTSGLERIDFLNPKWNVHNGRKIIRREWAVSSREGLINVLSEDETLYRQLKINYEKKRNYPDAGDFYIGEMEMRRMNPKTSIPERIIINLYKLISNYGESYWRAFGSILVFILVFSIILTFTGITIDNRYIDYYPIQKDNSNYINDLIEVAHIVLKAITLQPYSVSTTLIGLSSKIMTFITILGILLIALLTLALRRRFRR